MALIKTHSPTPGGNPPGQSELKRKRTSDRSRITARIKSRCHKKLRHTARLLHTKPGQLASWLLAISRPGRVGEKLATIQALQVTADNLQPLILRLYSWRRALDKAGIEAEPGTPELHRIIMLTNALVPVLRQALAALDLCQGVAAGLAEHVPAEAQPELEKVIRALPEALVQPETSESRRLAEYLIALGIVTASRPH